RVRIRAARLLAHAEGQEALQGLIVALRDPFPGVRRQAALSLATLGDERAVPFLSRRLDREKSPRVLAAALHALGASAGAYAAQLPLPFLDHPMREVRAAAAAALGRLGDPSRRDALLSALRYEPDDPGYTVRASILAALARLRLAAEVRTAVDYLVAEGGMGHWLCRAAVAGAIGDAGLSDRAPFVRTLLEKERDPRVVAAAAGALARLGEREAVRRNLGHSAAVVRRACLVALEDAGDAEALPSALALVRQDPDPAVRFEAALVLHRLRHPDADLYIVDALRSHEPLFWITALGALEKRHRRSFGRDPEAWSRWLKSKQARVRK
ncbi:MAG: HEAT repeat domain-containing protein, partial [Planctomycetota bacterium]